LVILLRTAGDKPHTYEMQVVELLDPPLALQVEYVALEDVKYRALMDCIDGKDDWPIQSTRH
jgi:hypothetical protein